MSVHDLGQGRSSIGDNGRTARELEEERFETVDEGKAITGLLSEAPYEPKLGPLVQPTLHPQSLGGSGQARQPRSREAEVLQPIRDDAKNCAELFGSAPLDRCLQIRRGTPDRLLTIQGRGREASDGPLGIFVDPPFNDPPQIPGTLKPARIPRGSDRLTQCRRQPQQARARGFYASEDGKHRGTIPLRIFIDAGEGREVRKRALGAAAHSVFCVPILLLLDRS
jgi:hypothetical protein